MKMASLLAPILRCYQFLLYPVTKPTAFLLDKWLGAEAIQYFKEKDLRELLKLHVEAPETDIENVEGRGALNFLAIDDLSIAQEGEPIDPGSIIQLNFINDRPQFPIINRTCEDEFLAKIHKGQKKWIVLINDKGEPKLILDSDGFLRSALFENDVFNPIKFCHRPIIIDDIEVTLGEAILKLKVHPEKLGDDVIDKDTILFWGDKKRIITGADILGRLLRGIVPQKPPGVSSAQP